ncbi:hypothetical protein [Loktanella sp. D2R18]|uniref:hypothetical protein n=2 Tax=Rhodobacterales TaxID=204455 RepID=UPI001C68C81D|nr:hypothetical protein [Loktanella sp. D2R18]
MAMLPATIKKRRVSQVQLRKLISISAASQTESVTVNEISETASAILSWLFAHSLLVAALIAAPVPRTTSLPAPTAPLTAVWPTNNVPPTVLSTTFSAVQADSVIAAVITKIRTLFIGLSLSQQVTRSFIGTGASLL